MSEIKIGDIVARKSYGSDVLFKVVDIKGGVVSLKGICYRIEADANETDLVVQTKNRITEYNSRIDNKVAKKARELYGIKSSINIKKNYFRGDSKGSHVKFQRPGKVLHLDGDESYLQTCIDKYRSLGIDVVGKYIPERQQALNLGKLLNEIRPDILVLTGHDGLIKGDKNYNKLDSYRNSKYFVESVKEARKYERDLDSLVIFAGACQSMYKDIIDAGANFASSPKRILIHALDPVFVAQKIALFNSAFMISPSDVIGATLTGADGIGGFQTRGKFREGFPAEPYK